MKKQTIEVDQDVFEALQALATPLVDTPNTVLRRLLIGVIGSDWDISTNIESARRRVSDEAPLGLLREESSRIAARAELWDPGEPVGMLLSKAGMSPRRFGKIICAREFPGEMFERARRDRGAFRTMFESDQRLLYFLNFNKPGATNLWYKLPKTALRALREAEKPAYVILTNPGDRVAWVVPLKDLQARYPEAAQEPFGEDDIDLNIDVKGNRVREWEWDIREWRREI